MWLKNGIRGRGPDLIHAGVPYIFGDSRPSRRRQTCPVFLRGLLGALPSTGSTTHRVTGLAHAFPPMKLLLKEALQWLDALAKAIEQILPHDGPQRPAPARRGAEG